MSTGAVAVPSVPLTAEPPSTVPVATCSVSVPPPAGWASPPWLASPTVRPAC